MRRNRLLGFLFAIAVITFALPLLPPSWNPIHHVPPSASPAPAPGEIHSAAKREATYKQQTVQRDMEATERLSRAQVNRDVQNFLRKDFMQPSRSRLQSFLNTHPEILYVEWTHRQDLEKIGKINLDLKEASKPFLTKARAAVKQGNSYSSPIFTSGGKSYFVLSQHTSSASVRQCIVALVSTEVIQAVERHQRRNLRLVPYPPEGRYRIESVVPGSNAETTVRTGEDNGNASHYAIDEIVVKFREPLTNKQLLQLRKELHLTIVRHTGKTYVFRSSQHETMELKKHFLSKWNPEFVEPSMAHDC